MEVRAEYTSSRSVSEATSTLIGPTCRHAIENRDGSSARPIVPLIPPVRAWLTWQATPGTLGSSKALMQTRSFLPMKRKVVLTHGRSSACTGAAAPARQAMARQATSADLIMVSSVAPRKWGWEAPSASIREPSFPPGRSLLQCSAQSSEVSLTNASNVRRNRDRQRFELDTPAGLAVVDYRLS